MRFLILFMMSMNALAIETVSLKGWESRSFKENLESMRMGYVVGYKPGEFDLRKTVLKELKKEAFEQNDDNAIPIIYLLELRVAAIESKMDRITELENLLNAFPTKTRYVKAAIFQHKATYNNWFGSKKQIIGFYEKAIQLYEDDPFHIELYRSLRNIALRLNIEGRQEDAIRYLDRMQTISERFDFKGGVAESYELLSINYSELSQIAKAMDLSFKCLDLAKEIQDYTLQVSCLNHIATHKSSLRKPDEELSYYLQAEKLLDKPFVRPSLKTMIYSNIAINYTNTGKYEKAREYAKKVIQLAREQDDVTEIIYPILSLANIENSIKQPDKALEALAELETLSDDSFGIEDKLGYYSLLIDSHRQKKNFQEGEKWLEKGVAFSIKSGHNAYLRQFYLIGNSFYKGQKKYKEALEYYEKFAELDKKIEQAKNSKLLYSKENEFKTKENEVLKKENELQKSNIEKKNQQRIFFLLVILGSVGVVILQINRHRVIRRKNESLQAQEKVIRQKSRDLQSVLDNINQGVVTIDAPNDDYRIKDASLHVYSILGIGQEKRLNGSNPLETLFGDTSLSNEVKRMIQSQLLVSLNEELFQWEINADKMPNEMAIRNGSAIIEIDWSVILGENSEVLEILITLKDVTAYRLLRKQQEESEKSIKKLVTLSKMEQREFFMFLKSTDHLIKDSLMILKEATEFDAESINVVFRNLHTIKGLARNYDFDDLSAFVHDIEDTFQKLREGNSPFDQDDCLLKIVAVNDEINLYRQLAETELNWSTSTASVTMPVSELSDWYENLQSTTVKDHDNEQKISRLLYRIKHKYAQTLKDSLENILMSVRKIAQDLGKGKIELEFSGKDRFISSAYQDKLRSIFVHLIRNSIDHGIYTIEERSKLNESSGKIIVELDQDDDAHLIRYRDNGRGINLNYLKTLANERKLDVNLDNEMELANLIFTSGVSSKKVLTDLSGRGVGMDAVKGFLENHGGSIKIEAHGEKRSPDFLPILFKIKLPKECFDS